MKQFIICLIILFLVNLTLEVYCPAGLEIRCDKTKIGIMYHYNCVCQEINYPIYDGKDFQFHCEGNKVPECLQRDLFRDVKLDCFCRY